MQRGFFEFYRVYMGNQLSCSAIFFFRSVSVFTKTICSFYFFFPQFQNISFSAAPCVFINSNSVCVTICFAKFFLLQRNFYYFDVSALYHICVAGVGESLCALSPYFLEWGQLCVHRPTTRVDSSLQNGDSLRVQYSLDREKNRKFNGRISLESYLGISYQEKYEIFAQFSTSAFWNFSDFSIFLKLCTSTRYYYNEGE